MPASVESAADPFRNSGRVVIGGENPLASLAEAQCLDGGTPGLAQPRDQVRALGYRRSRFAAKAHLPTLPAFYSAAAARANGLPSESRQIAQRSPGWTIDPPSSRTRSRAVAMSSTVR